MPSGQTANSILPVKLLNVCFKRQYVQGFVVKLVVITLLQFQWNDIVGLQTPSVKSTCVANKIGAIS